MTLLEGLADTLLDVAKPLTDALASPTAFAALLRRNGWRAPALDADIAAVTAAFGLAGDVQKAVSRLEDLVGNSDALESDLLQAIDAVSKVWNDLRALGRPAGTLPAPFDRDDFWSSFPGDLVQDLFLTYLERARPLLFAPLHLFGILDETNVPPPPGDRARVPYSQRDIHWDRIATLLAHPENLAHDVYGWGGTLDHDRLLGRLERVLLALRLPAARLPPMHALAARYYPPATPAPPTVRELRVPIFVEHGRDGTIEIGLEMLPVPDAPGGDVRGLALGPYAAGQAVATLPIGRFTLALHGGLDAQSAALQISPGQVRAMFDPGGTTINAGAAISASPQQPWILLGDEDSFRIELADVTLALELAGAANDPELKLRLHSDALRIVIDPAGSDGFLQELFGSNPQTLSVGGDVVWSSKQGLTFAGQAGLRLVVPIHESFGPAHIDAVSITISAAGNAVRTAFGVTGGGKLGPVAAVVQDLGLALTFTPVQPPARGKFGDLDLDFGFQPPSGVGLSVEAAGAVTGGGFLFHDPAQGLYAGVMQLSLEDRFTVTAFGLIATRMPDGSPGYSLIIFITAEDFQPIPLGLGFTLQGIGGMVAINRTFDQDALRAGMQNDTLKSLLFPRDPVNNAPAIVRALSTAFPAQRGSYLFGVLARIGWFTPTLITLDLALILEFGVRRRLLVLGRISSLLPSPDNDLVRINLDAIGVLDFDQDTASIDAMLVDSRLAHKYALTGAAALRAGWGSGPSSNFVLAVGGFNPRFAPPAGVPPLARVAIALCSGNNPRLTCEAYLAITANTLQFGARADLYAEAYSFSIAGDIGFDVLITRAPLHFIADFHASIQLKYGSENLFKVAVNGTLEGPRPLRLSGKASFEIFWCDFSVRFDKTLIEGEPPPPPPAIDVLSELTRALSTAQSWSTQPPAGRGHGVALRKLAPGAALVLDPLGRLVVSEDVVPLDTTRDVEVFGGAPVAGARRFALTASLEGIDLTQLTPLQAPFAPAQFFAMTDDEKLASPSFDDMDAGFIVGTEAVSIDANPSQLVAAPLEYDVIVIDALAAPVPPPAPTPYRLPAALLAVHAATGAAARAPVRRVGRARFRTAAQPAVSVAAPAWAIAPLDAGPAVALDPNVKSWSEHLSALAALNRAGVRFQLVPARELAT